MSPGITRDQVERLARVCKTNQDAARALGIAIRALNEPLRGSPTSLSSRLCRRFGIESPWWKRRHARLSISQTDGDARDVVQEVCVGRGRASD
ncbi:MAG: hypothetical protein AB1505_16465 [Candidatus Latescibacterota bacterium]